MGVIDDAVSEKIIGCAYRIGNALGMGFLEKVYENAMVHELTKAGLSVKPQFPVKVLYDDVVVGDFCADILVDQKVIIEVKAVKALNDIHCAQCLNYLKATGYKLCLLINFGGPRVDVKRISL